MTLLTHGDTINVSMLLRNYKHIYSMCCYFFTSMKYIDKCLTVNTEANALEISLKWLPHHCAVMH